MGIDSDVPYKSFSFPGDWKFLPLKNPKEVRDFNQDSYPKLQLPVFCLETGKSKKKKKNTHVTIIILLKEF